MADVDMTDATDATPKSKSVTKTTKASAPDTTTEGSKKRFEVKKVDLPTQCTSVSRAHICSGMPLPYGRGTLSLITVPSVETTSWISVSTLAILYISPANPVQASNVKQTKDPPQMKNAQ